ncbi:hypothetical protein [Petrimonas mucosa]|jgi:hypothetical protein|uniref:hypothetical protein n=1 Tax=Petrimonas mucosa TaxID=1642646 RepID=UPI001777F2B4|nr:hypothetical protein [Petrimonas mucosa]HHT30561.1 hypothetical protein [Petrimonas mucosa]
MSKEITVKNEIMGLPEKAAAIGNVLDSAKIIISDITNMVNLIQQETTKREAIRANRDVIIEKTKAFREVMLEVMDRTFDERKDLFDGYFARLDKAMDKNDTQMVAGILSNMVDLAKNGPLKNLVDIAATQKALKDPDTVWEF